LVNSKRDALTVVYNNLIEKKKKKKILAPVGIELQPYGSEARQLNN